MALPLISGHCSFSQKVFCTLIQCKYTVYFLSCKFFLFFFLKFCWVLPWGVRVCVSRLEGREAGAKHGAKRTPEGGDP
jgi:hypothetical protein